MMDEPCRHVRLWSMVATMAMSLVLASCVGTAWITPVLASVPKAKPFGITRFTMQTIDGQKVEAGPEKLRVVSVPATSTQAGGHPWGLTTTVEFTNEAAKQIKAVVPTRDPKDVIADIPPGLLGDPQAVPRCPLAVILANAIARCPADTQVGMVRLRWFGGDKESFAPIVNTVPEPGQSAEFGLETEAKVTVLLTAHVIRNGSTYGLTLLSSNITLVELVEFETTFWGVPTDPSHDAMRKLLCFGTSESSECFGGNVASGIPSVPFLTMPTDCTGGPVTTRIHVDSWEEPGVFRQASASMPPVTGCNRLQFEPSIEAQPDTLLADAPVGLGVNLKVPQVENPKAAATPELRDSVVTLPEGLSVSPGIVDGIQACNESGPEGINFEGPESEEVGLNGELQLAPGHCPDASIVGTAEAETPLLPSPVKGHVYLARPGCGGDGQAPCTERDALDGNLYQSVSGTGRDRCACRCGSELEGPSEDRGQSRNGAADDSCRKHASVAVQRTTNPLERWSQGAVG